MLAKQLVENPDDIARGEAAANPDRQPLARELIDHRQTFELPGILGLIKHKIVAPHVVREAGPLHPLRGGAQKPAFAAFSHHLQPYRRRISHPLSRLIDKRPWKCGWSQEGDVNLEEFD